jgi:hypothetical protein
VRVPGVGGQAHPPYPASMPPPDPEVRVLIDVPIVFDVIGGTTVHSPMVRATVGGVATRLILDTGSTDHVLTKDLIDAAGAPAEPAEPGTDHAGASVPSWWVGKLDVRIGDETLGLREVVAIEGPAPFAAWGVGGFLSPQHLHPAARVLIDLIGDRLVVAAGPLGSVDAWLIDRCAPALPLVLDRVPGEAVVAVQAAIEPFAPVTTTLNTGGRATEFASAAVPGLGGTNEREGGAGVSGAPVIGSDVGPRDLRVEGARIPVANLVVRPHIDGPDALVGMDVLRGTALIVGADRSIPVTWLVPSARLAL